MAKTCFLIGPYGSEHSKERLWSDFVLKNIVQPACGEDYLAQRTIDDPNLNPSQTIDSHILEALDAAEIVCADLTESNPNAFYELGVRQARGKPFILLCRRDTEPPFDIKTYPRIMLQASFVDDLKIFAMSDEEKTNAVKLLSDRIKHLAERMEKSQEAPRQRTSESHLCKVYKWTTTYAQNVASDWLAKQSPEFQKAVEDWDNNKGDAGIQKADEVRFAEYVQLKGAVSQVYNGRLWYIVNRATEIIEAGYAVYEFSNGGSVVIDLSGSHSLDRDQIVLTFDQPGRPVEFSRFKVQLPPYSYSVEFTRRKPSGDSFFGELMHPDTGTLVGKARLIPAYGF